MALYGHEIGPSITPLEAPLYAIAQVAAAILASFTLKLCLPLALVQQSKLGMTVLAPGFERPALFVLELLGTLLLVSAVLFAAVSERVPDAAAGVSVGGALCAGILFAGPVTGGGLNPARVLGPMVAMGEFTNLQTYLLAQLLAGAIAGGIYLVFKDVPPPAA